jgi:hypothetical protein
MTLSGGCDAESPGSGGASPYRSFAPICGYVLLLTDPKISTGMLSILKRELIGG